jgi:8-oxo-dGTP pyrophosphatase MutT (NUDIX family)
VQVYAVYYEPSGRFLIGYKPAKGYYFYNSGRGRLVRAGQPLNGGDNYALPGGKREGQEPIADAARREFMEETAAQIDAIQTDTHQFKDKEHEYGAAFFRIEPVTFNAVAYQITDRNLPEGLVARDAVIDGTITQYAQIHQRFRNAPQDNEFGAAQVWNVNDPTEWSNIARWKDDPVVSWYYQILLYLKQSIL